MGDECKALLARGYVQESETSLGLPLFPLDFPHNLQIPKALALVFVQGLCSRYLAPLLNGLCCAKGLPIFSLFLA